MVYLGVAISRQKEGGRREGRPGRWGAALDKASPRRPLLSMRPGLPCSCHGPTDAPSEATMRDTRVAPCPGALPTAGRCLWSRGPQNRALRADGRGRMTERVSERTQNGPSAPDPAQPGLRLPFPVSTTGTGDVRRPQGLKHIRLLVSLLRSCTPDPAPSSPQGRGMGPQQPPRGASLSTALNPQPGPEAETCRPRPWPGALRKRQ